MLGTDFLQHEPCKPDQIVTISSEQNNSAEYSAWKKNTARFMKTLFMVGLISTAPGAYAKPSRKLNSASSASEIDGLNGSLLGHLPRDAELYLAGDSTTIAPVITQLSSPYVDTTLNNIPWWDRDNKHKIYQDETGEIKLKCSPNSNEDEQGRLKAYLKDMRGWLDSTEEEGKACVPYDEGRCKYKKLSLLKNAFCNKELQKNLKAQLEGIPDTRDMMSLDAYNALPELIVPKLIDNLLDGIHHSCENNQAICAENNHLLNYLSQFLNANINKFIQLIKDAELTSQIATLELEDQANIMDHEIQEAIKYVNEKSPVICKKVEEIWEKDLPFIVVKTIEDMYLSLEGADLVIFDNTLKQVLEAYNLFSYGVPEYIKKADQLEEILNQWTDHKIAKPNDTVIHQQMSKKIEERQKKYNYKKSPHPMDDLDEIDFMMFGMNLHHKQIENYLTQTKESINKILSHYKTEVISGEKRAEILLLAENIIQQEKTIKYLLVIQQNLFEALPYPPVKLQTSDPDLFSDIEINSDSIHNKDLPPFRKIIDEL